MRVCLFSASVDTLQDGAALRRVQHALGTEDIVCVTNSWADVAEDSPVRVTGRARTPAMRVHRRLSNASGVLARAAARVLGSRVNAALLEALRAADADLIVCTTPGLLAQIRMVVREANAPWACVSLDALAPCAVRTFRRYDRNAKVSIVLPTFNGTRYLRQSILSCLQQTHRNIELVVVDDGSSEPIEDVLRGFSDPRIVFVRHSRNQGPPTSLNTGFAHASGDFRTWTSDDNEYLPSAVEEMVRFLHTYPEVDFVYAESWRIDERGELMSPATMRVQPPESLSKDNFIGACFLYKREVQASVGDYNPDAELAEDYDYWVRVSRQFTMQRLFRQLYRYRHHPSSLTATRGRGDVARKVAAIRRQLQPDRWSVR